MLIKQDSKMRSERQWQIFIQQKNFYTLNFHNCHRVGIFHW